MTKRLFRHEYLYAVALFAIVLLIPRVAFGFFDIEEALKGFVLSQYNGTIDNITVIASGDALYGNEWSRLLSSNTSASTMLTQSLEVTKAFGACILAIALMSQLIKLFQRATDHGTLPLVREVVVLVFFAAIFNYLLQNADTLLIGLFRDGMRVTAGIGNSAAGELNVTTATSLNASIGELLSGAISGLIMYIFSLILRAIVDFQVYSRAIQLYVYVLLAPIPLALMGYESTRQMGINFLLRFLALVLSSAVVVFIIRTYAVVGTVIFSGGGVGPAALPNVAGAIDVGTMAAKSIQVIVLSLVYGFSIMKAGSITQSVLGV